MVVIMSNLKLTDSQISQLLFINEQGFICRKEITGFASISERSKHLWNRKANKPIDISRIRIIGYKAEKTEYLREVLLFGREVADKNVGDIRRAAYQNRNVKIDNEDEPAEPYVLDNSDLFMPDFIDYSANNQIGYLSVYG